MAVQSDEARMPAHGDVAAQGRHGASAAAAP
ncbi:MAG: hypothetical protein JWR63_2203, partial [Conexibacter sp.]|nr:hypothetical protein [Conexibacter sp.]